MEPSCLFLGPDIYNDQINMPTVTEVINIFEKIQCYCVQNINEQLFSLLPNQKFNISCDIKSMLVPNVYLSGSFPSEKKKFEIP